MFNPNLPLLDLHRHLDGNIRPETIWQLAQQNNIVLPEASFEQFIPHVQITKSEPNLLAFLEKLDWGVKVLVTLDNVKRIAFENVEDAYNAQIDYAELRFSPYYIAMTHQLPLEGVVEAIIDGIAQGTKKFNIKINLIGILSRTFGIEACMQELNALLAYKKDIIAIDLAGDEYNFPGKLFEQHFVKAVDNGMHITVHAGEAAGSESVWHAIKTLKAERIGHGVACASDEGLMQYMRENKIAIESCLTSNYQTGTVANLAEHPIKTFLKNDLLVCLNTDDPAVEAIELPHEFVLAKNTVNLSESELDQLQKNAVEVSFLSTNEKKALFDKKK